MRKQVRWDFFRGTVSAVAECGSGVRLNYSLESSYRGKGQELSTWWMNNRMDYRPRWVNRRIT